MANAANIIFYLAHFNIGIREAGQMICHVIAFGNINENK